MRSFPTNFAAEKNKKTGIAPIWILKLTVNAVDYYISDQVATISGWNSGVTTKAWVASWGAIQEQLVGTTTEVRIADFQVSLLIDPDASPNMETLALHSTLEKAPVSLYLWFSGLTASTDPPQELFRGYVRDAEIPDDMTVQLAIEDATVRLHNLVGTLVSTATYANADPDHIGKILPLPYGVVRNVPAITTVSGLLTTLKADITAAATSCAVARPDGIVANTTKFKIGSEIVKVTAVTGDTLTISRAQDSTTAAVHSAGDRMLEVMASPFVFVVSGHALTSIDKVLVRSGATDIDVTDQCTRYTGQVASQYSTYGAKGVITITQAQADVIKARVLKAAELALSDPEHTHSSSVIVTAIQPDNAVYNAYAATDTGGGSIDSMVDGNPMTFCRFEDVSTGGEGKVDLSLVTALGMSGTPKRVRTVCKLGTIANASNATCVMFWKGTSRLSTTCSASTTTTSSWYDIPDSEELWTNFLGSSSTKITVESNEGIIEVYGAWYEVEFDPTPPSSSTGITGSINSVADQLIGGQILADVTAPTTNPDAVISDLINTWGGISSLTLDGTFGASYKFNGVLLAQEKLLDLVQRLAWQCCAWFRILAGSARLVVRPGTLTSEKTISACRAEDTGRVYTRRKTEIDDIVNTINLRYNRDWTMDDGDDAYLAVSSTTDATSITDYGTRESADLFRMDMITSSTMADSVRDFYLADLKRRKWMHEFEVHLDHAELEFGDVVTLGFSGNAVVELMQAGFVPGNTAQIDVIRMIGRG